MTTTPLGTRVATCSRAVSCRRSDTARSGDEISHVGIIAYNKHAEIVHQNLKRGRPVMVEGHLYRGKATLHLAICSSAGCIYRIHGTPDESVSGERVTGGCVRMPNADVWKLAHRVPSGTEVTIAP